MLGTIFKIEDNQVFIKLNVDISNIQNLMNLFVIIQDSNTSFIGEIVNVDLTNATINLLGEYKNNSFIYGYIKKPSFTAKVNLIASEYIEKIINPNNLSLSIGKFPFYDNVTVNASYGKILIRPIEITIYTVKTRAADGNVLSKPYDGEPLYEYRDVHDAESQWGTMNFDLWNEEVRSFLISTRRER